MMKSGSNCTGKMEVAGSGALGLQTQPCQECGLAFIGTERHGMFLSKGGRRSSLNLRELSGKMEESPRRCKDPLWDPEHERMKFKISSNFDLLDLNVT